jgi:O-antigen ligase/tetratricopeptide (TPR) repeat protein
MLSKILSRTIFILLLLSTITPLVFQKKLFYSYDSEKGLFFRLIIEIIFGLWLILILKEPSFRPKKSPINLALGFLSIVLIIVDFLGVDWYLSVFSNFERMAGLITYLSVFAFCLVASSIINSPKRWLIVGISLSTVAFIVATKGIIQFYHPEEVVVANERIVSTIGNANQLASYLILGFFVVGLLISEWILPLKKTKPFLSIFLLIIAFIYVFTYAFCLFKTSTRGALAGLILGTGLMLFLTFIKTHQPKIKALTGGILVVALLTISGLFYFRNSSFVQQNYALNRITRITDRDGSNTLQSRLETYKVAIEGIKAKPFLGWGQETFHYVYAQHFNPKLYADATWYDRPHNIILEWLITGGIVGLLAYLSLWGAVLFQLWRKNSRLNLSVKIILSGFLMAYFIGNMSLFDNLLSLLAFMMVIAFIENHSSTSEAKQPLDFSNKIIWSGSFVVLISTIFLLKITCQKAYQTNKMITSAYAAGSLDEVIDTYAQAYPNALIGRQEIAEQLATMAKDIANSPVPANTKQRYFETARNIMQSEISKHPDYARLQIIYANLLEAQGDNVEATKVLEIVQKLAPKRQSSLAQLAMLYAKNQQFEKANNLLESAYNLESKNEEMKANQALVMAMKGDRESRDKIVNQLSDKELPKHISIIQSAFALTNDLNTFFEICNKRLVGNENTTFIAYKTWAMTAYNLKNTRETATAVFCFRLHFTQRSEYIDSREALQIRQDVLEGKNPEFAFEKVTE